MKKRILSVVLALALCAGLLPAPARAAGTALTAPLDFTNVGDADGQTPASGDGYTWEGDSTSGYKLTLNGISLNVTDPPEIDYSHFAIRLPKDGSVTVEVNGQNTITINEGSAIGCRGDNTVTFQGSGALHASARSTLIHTTGSMVIKDVTIEGTSPGGGLFSLQGNITIENATINIDSEASNAAPISAQAGDILIKNSNIIVLSDNLYAILAGNGNDLNHNITITGGTVAASSNKSGGGAIVAMNDVTISGGAKVTGTGSGFGVYARNNMTLSRSEVSAKGETTAFRFASLSLEGMAIAEPSDGKIGTNAILNADDSPATSAKLSPITLNTPTDLTCTYGDDSVKVTLTSTPASGGEVVITEELGDGSSTEWGRGKLGEEIALDISSLVAGSHFLTATAGDVTANFILRVNKKALTVAGATAKDRAYDKTNEVEITGVTLDGVKPGDESDAAVDLTGLKGTISGPDVGTYDAVTLPYTMKLIPEATVNYTLTLPDGPVPATVTISKAGYTGDTAAESAAKFGSAGTCDLSSLLQGIDGAALGMPTTSSDIFGSDFTTSGNTLSYTLVNEEAEVGSTGTITVPVTSKNYTDFDITVTVTVSAKHVPTLSVSPINVTYNGEAVPVSAIKGTAKVGGTGVPGKWSFIDAAPINVADSGTKRVKFTPDDPNTYAEVEGTVTVTISKATPTGAPKYTAITESGKTLADAGLTTDGGTFSVPGNVHWELGDDTEVTANTEYKWIFVPADSGNYNTLTGRVTLWRRSTGGGGGGGGSYTPPVTTGTTTQGGVSTTETTATPTASTSGGKAAAAVDAAMGSEIVKQAAEHKSKNVVIAPKVTGGVTKAEVSVPASTVGQIGTQTSASLTISTPVAGVTIPNGGLGSLASGGGTVTVSAEKSGNTVELAVAAGGKAVDSIPGGLTLTVPVEHTAPGTVAVLVKADGTREVVRKSVANDRAVTIPLDGSATVEIVDNSRQFADVPEAGWKAEAAAFVSAHELFSGTAPGQFSPDTPMSRGMLAVVLHNLERNPAQPLTGVFADVNYGEWYAEAVNWAAANGIVNGYGGGRFAPNDRITREQLAVMLWRYAGSPAVNDRELRFADSDQAGDWALGALCWAVNQGIMNGKGGGILDPGGYATRAETAQMVKNFMERVQ